MENVELERLSLPDKIIRFVEENLNCHVLVSSFLLEQTNLNTDTYFVLAHSKGLGQVVYFNVLCKYDGTIDIKQVES